MTDNNTQKPAKKLVFTKCTFPKQRATSKWKGWKLRFVTISISTLPGKKTPEQSGCSKAGEIRK